MGGEGQQGRQDKRQDRRQDRRESWQAWLPGFGYGDQWDWWYGEGGKPAEPDFHDIYKDSEDTAAERFEQIYEKIEDLAQRAEDIPTFSDWMDESGLELQGYDDQMVGIQALIDRLQAGPTDEEYDSAFSHAARLLGMNDEELHATIGDLTRQMAAGMSGQEGFSDAERAIMQRQNQARLRDMEARSQRLVQDTFAETGSSARMLETANQYGSQINNMQIQQDVEMMNLETERQMAQFMSYKESQGQLVQARQIGVQQYMTNLQEGISAAMEGYAAQADLIYRQNQDYFQSYAADLGAFVASIDAMYKAIQLEIGATAAEIQAIGDLYTARVKPYIDDITYRMMKHEMAFGLDEIMDLLGYGAQIAQIVATMS